MKKELNLISPRNLNETPALISNLNLVKLGISSVISLIIATGCQKEQTSAEIIEEVQESVGIHKTSERTREELSKKISKFLIESQDKRIIEANGTEVVKRFGIGYLGSPAKDIYENMPKDQQEREISFMLEKIIGTRGIPKKYIQYEMELIKKGEFKKIDNQIELSVYSLEGNLAGLKELLGARGGDIHCLDKLGNKAVFSALSDSNPKILEYLISQGADVNAYSSYGITPLMYAVILHNIDGMKLLLSAGAKISKNDNKGKTVYHYIEKDKDNKILKLLDSYKTK
ncbi:MAG: ankyrin repeat domain-containing protein [Candidatus Gracilibacteria bacterium]|nr:ankyrin repeat domain-containing protein [Candidatus Gracilibacteria bacterium]MDD2908505.1 ankyrin repeat domain-containing protein [Candidatus Gracilibacteria bacterium]